MQVIDTKRRDSGRTVRIRKFEKKRSGDGKEVIAERIWSLVRRQAALNVTV